MTRMLCARDNGSLVAAALDQPPVLGGEVAVAFAHRGAGTLDERRAEQPIGGAGATAQALPRPLVGPGQKPAQAAAWPAVGKRVMSAPSSATMISARHARARCPLPWVVCSSW